MHMRKILPILILLLAGAAPTLAQDPFVVEFESARGQRLAAILDSATVSLRDRLDANGDGALDLVTIRDDSQGNPEMMVVFDVASGMELGSLLLQDVDSALMTDDHAFVGFLDFDGNGNRDALFRSRAALAVFADFTGGKRGADEAFVLPMERAAVLDIDGDGLAELIIQHPTTQTVQVWGSGEVGTATEDEIAGALLRLSQNYPNPFREATTIAYAVERAGPVTVAVYDLLGRRVRTLVDREQPPGAYQVAWDGRDAGGQPVASGTYFYRLRVGEAVSSKQAIRVK